MNQVSPDGGFISILDKDTQWDDGNAPGSIVEPSSVTGSADEYSFSDISRTAGGLLSWDSIGWMSSTTSSTRRQARMTGPALARAEAARYKTIEKRERTGTGGAPNAFGSPIFVMITRAQGASAREPLRMVLCLKTVFFGPMLSSWA